MKVKVIVHWNQQSFFGKEHEMDQEQLDGVYKLLGQHHVMNNFLLYTTESRISFPAQIIQQSLIEVIVKE